MRKILFLVFASISILLLSNISFAQKDVFLKEYKFELKKVSENQYENEYFLTLTLNKNSIYKFTILNHIGDFPGDAVVEVLENDKVVATNAMGEKYFDKFMFKCTKTGFYDILIHYKDNKTGSSLIKLFLMQNT
ncbi:MAG: hypothetical protein MI739_10580 [Bacteroidales bacterium]|nr:hypothetical protein [Bacteroidales bacterium]